jgi:quercetin dioxygenase-like cupin family protein
MNAVTPVQQTAAPTYLFNGALMKIHLTGPQTGGRFCMLESYAPPGHATPPHVHDHEDEAFYVLEGELEMVVGGRTMTVRAGESAFAPRGIPHQLRNVTSRPVRGIVIATDAGFAEFVMQAGIPASADPATAPSPEWLMETAARFGIRLAA